MERASGDGYEYESGAYALVRLEWSEIRGEFMIGTRQGAFPEMVRERGYSIVFISQTGTETMDVRYTGDAIRVLAEMGRSDGAR